MSHNARLPRHSVLAAIVTSIALTFGITAPALAQGHRASISADLNAILQGGASATVKVIVNVSPAQIDALAARSGARVSKRLVSSAVLEVTREQLEALRQDASIDHISGDARVQRMMAVTTKATGADQVWGGFSGLPSYTGRGIGVAIVDSGFAAHLSLKGKVAAAFDLTNGKAGDEYGHGTHVGSIVAGAASGDSNYAGMAPGAHLISLRVLDADGSGDTSDVIAAIDLAIANRFKYNIRIINLSLGHPVFESYRLDPLCQAVERAVKAGIVVVAAAGNFGKASDGRKIVGGIVSPGNSPAALTVGALNTKGTAAPFDDVMATYTSLGLTYLDGLLKPDLVAPGNRIVAAAAVNSTLLKAHPEMVVSGQGTRAYAEMSGTSMAAAVVSGAAALLLEARPELTPSDVKL